MNKFGFQTQSGTAPDWHLIDFTRAAAVLLYGNALNLDMARLVRQRSPQTLILLRAPAWDWYVDTVWTMDFARECARVVQPFLAAGLCDAVLSPNEPVVKNVEEAKRLNECQVLFSNFVHSNLGVDVVAYNFSVGNPDYPLVEHLRTGAESAEYIGLHCYGYSYPDYRLGTAAEHYALRYRRFMQLLGVSRRVIVTETGIDTRDGGYKSPRAYESGIRVGDLLDDLKWQQQRANEDDYLAACILFGAGMEGSLIKWKSFDVLDDPGHHQAFRSFVSGLEPVTAKITPGVPTIPPPDPEPEPEPPAGGAMNPSDLVASIPALLKKAAEQKLGAALSGEVYFDSNGKRYVRQVFAGGVVVTQEGQWALSQIEVRDALTGQPIMAPPSPPPTDTPPPSDFVFPPALTAIGAVGVPGVPVAGLPFYRLNGASVRRGISAFMVVTVFSHGAPKIGAKVVNLFPDGNGEVVETDGSGNARFQFGASSAFTTPGTGPFTVFVADDSAFKDFDAVPKRVVYQQRLSDVVKSLGDFQGEHTEIYMQLIEQEA